MKFEDMKKIWNEQDQKHQYVIDEKVLHESIQAKKRKSSRFVNKMEWILIGTNSFSGGVLIVMNFIKHVDGYYTNALGVLMLATAVFIYFRRSHRLKNENRFDRSMLGDLDHAINNATYRAQLSYGMLIYFVLVAILVMGNAIYEETSALKIALIAAFLIVVWFLGRWEHRSWHLAHKKRLELMKVKLMESV